MTHHTFDPDRAIHDETLVMGRFLPRDIIPDPVFVRLFRRVLRELAFKEGLLRYRWRPRRFTTAMDQGYWEHVTKRLENETIALVRDMGLCSYIQKHPSGCALWVGIQPLDSDNYASQGAAIYYYEDPSDD